ncbi:hypothetical protein BDV28DRAFT_146850 [Aspergillus coremiiformis]|uniref:TauD/TfdA-like domain-containing protein n=1 Tax=Aspergillus coremiiformis TaxID=138285 RepID=A0A5N6ZF84_9EURO|nr:hypothetical protein BDV28DRAFT_146850 [Aspergillus coremiiformis]
MAPSFLSPTVPIGDYSARKGVTSKLSYPAYLPVWDNEPSKYPPLTPFDHHDPGVDADPSLKDLLPEGQAQVTNLTPMIGAEVHGVQLSQLTKEGKEQLALFVAQKKVVAFRNQDFANLPIEKILAFGGFFGRNHIHPASGAPRGFPEVHSVFRGENDKSGALTFERRTTSVSWHSDVSYELQPPGTTFLLFLDGPPNGGDTLFVNQAAAYERLSPAFRERLHGLSAVHSAAEQAQASLSRGGACRRDPIQTAHPIVRTHPATGEKALYVNRQFTRYIEGLKTEESEALLQFLYTHIAMSQDIQCRVKWEKDTVVVWDNRVTAHSAIYDFPDGHLRHLVRITPQAERPTE